VSPRHRRLLADLAQMHELATRTPQISFLAEGDPPETYQLMLNAAGLARRGTGELVVRQVHRCAIYLHDDYPRRPPVITWLTPIVHPNILPPNRNGGVCIGSWSASESLADLTSRLFDLVAYRSFNLEDALDRDAAAIVSSLAIAPGADLARALSGVSLVSELEVEVAIGSRGRR
jgi:ubiquitin-protein ligase